MSWNQYELELRRFSRRVRVVRSSRIPHKWRLLARAQPSELVLA